MKCAQIEHILLDISQLISHRKGHPMNNEEKILELLEELNAHIGTIETGQAALGGHLDRIKGEQSLINLKLENSSYLQTALEGRMARFETLLEGMQGDLSSVKARLDLDIEKRFDAINEGIDTILESLTPQSKIEALEADVVVLKTAIKAMAQRIAELEKAQ